MKGIDKKIPALLKMYRFGIGLETLKLYQFIE